MKTFIVVGNQWERKVEIDESDFEKYGDMAMEAMTRVTEDILNNEEEAIKLYENDIDNCTETSDDNTDRHNYKFYYCWARYNC